MNRFQVRYTSDEQFQDTYGICRDRMRSLTPDVRLSGKTITQAGIMSMRNMPIDRLLELDKEYQEYKGVSKSGQLITAASISRSFEDVGRWVQAGAAYNHGLRRDIMAFFHYGILNLSRLDDQTFADLINTSLVYEEEAPATID